MITTTETTTPAVRVGHLERDKFTARLGLACALALSAGLNLWNLAQNGYDNLYYSVAVQSMLQSLHNFFFAAYDGGGFISVDKPPVALWIQALSAKLFGFNPLALLLPEALAGVAAVGLLYGLVRRLFGTLAATVAALALALTPIAVAVERGNNTDTWLMFTLLLAAWAITLATERGRLAWLVVSMSLVGVAFNIKMLEAFIVLPTFYLLYLVAAPLRWYTRLLHLTLGGFVVLAVALSWPLTVDLTPAAARPWVGGSQTNSVLELALGYNGLGRVTGQGETRGGFRGGPPPGGLPNFGNNGGAPGGLPNFGGNPAPNRGGGRFGGRLGGGGGGGLFDAGIAGPTRLFTGAMAEQWSWLFPLALIGGLVATASIRRRLPLEPRGQAILLWGGWLATYGIVFSMAQGIFHPYYLIVLAPATAALVGIGVAALWAAYRRGSWYAWFLPSALLLTAVWQSKVLIDYPAWSVWLTPLTLGGSLLAAVPLVATRLLSVRVWRRWAPGLVGVGLLALLLAPLAWALTPVLAAPTNASLPEAGPATVNRSDPSSWTRTQGTSNTSLVAFLKAGSADYFYLVAVSTAQQASALALESGKPVLAPGGFMGSDPALTADGLATMVAQKQLRYVMGLGTGRMSSNSTVSSWIASHCVVVDSSLYGGASGSGGFGGFGGGGQLYDCAAQ